MQEAGLEAIIIEALGHPTRVLILQMLLRRPVSAVMVSRSHQLDLSHVSYHFRRVLFTKLNLVRIRSRHTRRGAEEKVFALKDEFYGDVVRGLLSLDHGPPGAGAHSAWEALAADDQGVREIRHAVVELAATVRAVRDRCAACEDPDQLHELFVGAAYFDRSGATRDGLLREA
jgi:DNA-binding transcriptional ArsR family regulator